jgi:hypothetical protein
MGNGNPPKESWISNVLRPAIVFRALARGEKKLARESDPRRQEGGLPTSHPEELPHLSSLASLAIIFFLSALYVAWGLTAYYTIGMKWPPPWHFGEVQDLPASSEYSTEMGNRFLSSGQPERLMSPLPQPQHVMERPERREPPGR